MLISDWSSDVCSSDFVDLVILGGGDGTMNLAAEAMRECGRPLGILPLGTAKDLARTLGIPPSLDEACRSDERRVGKECVSTCRSRWVPDHDNKKKQYI